MPFRGGAVSDCSDGMNVFVTEPPPPRTAARLDGTEEIWNIRLYHMHTSGRTGRRPGARARSSRSRSSPGPPSGNRSRRGGIHAHFLSESALSVRDVKLTPRCAGSPSRRARLLHAGDLRGLPEVGADHAASSCRDQRQIARTPGNTVVRSSGSPLRPTIALIEQAPSRSGGGGAHREIVAGWWRTVHPPMGSGHPGRGASPPSGKTTWDPHEMFSDRVVELFEPVRSPTG